MSLVTSPRAASTPAVTTRPLAFRPTPRHSAPNRFDTAQSSGFTSVKCVRSHEPRACQENRVETVRSSVAVK